MNSLIMINQDSIKNKTELHNQKNLLRPRRNRIYLKIIYLFQFDFK